jgi:hypothetical protein
MNDETREPVKDTEHSVSPPTTGGNAAPEQPTTKNPPSTHKADTGSWNKVTELFALIIAIGLLATSIFQTRATRRAADAARDSVILARDNARLDQRAWVSIRSVKLTTPYSLTGKGRITVAIANSGKTPALYVDMTRAGFGPSPNPDYSSTILAASMTIAPGSSDDEMFIDVPPADPDKTVYLRFVIEYWDIFQQATDKPHETVFCGYYPTTQPPFFFNTTGCSTMN